MGRKSSELSVSCKEIIINLLQDGNSFGKVSQLLSIPKSTIFSVWKKYSTQGSVENLPRSGRKKSIDDRAARNLIRHVRNDRKSVLSDITNRFNENYNAHVSNKTVWRCLRKNNYKRCVCKKKIRIRVANRIKRVRWCSERRGWTVEQNWKNVIFSDESQIVLGSDDRVYIWRKSDEAWLPDCISPGVQKKFSAMIWGCITYHGVGTICRIIGNINSQKYIEILEDNLWPVIARHFANTNFLFMDDNATVHKSRLTNVYKLENDISSLEWPAQSPDKNPIENVWLKIKRGVRRVSHLINTNEDLYNQILRIWESFSVEYIQSLYASLPARIQRVQKARGYITKY